MPRMTGKQALVEMLRAEGVRHVFGNPGTTEMPLLDALQDAPDLQYILGLHEATPLFMADGYARATGRPAFVNLHISVGIGNGIGALYNVHRGGVPVVLTAGQSDTRLLLHEATLWSNMVDVVRNYTKWSAEVLHAQDLPMAIRRAFKVAKTPPTGPVFLALPWNVLDEEADVHIAPSASGYFRTRPDAQAVVRAARLLARARNPLMVVGERVGQANASLEAARVAEHLGAPVYATTFASVNFPTSHDLYLGMLNTGWPPPRVKRMLEEADLILAVGTDLFSQFAYTPEPLLGPGTRVVHLDSSAWEIEKQFPVEVGLWCDPKAGLEDLAQALDAELTSAQREAAQTRAAIVAREKARRRQAFQQRVEKSKGQVPISPEVMMAEVRKALPEGAIIADESITVRGALMNALDFNRPGDLYGAQGGGLGWGMPGALGVQMAHPDRPVVAVVGDGAAMYTIQALWTAARYNIPVTYVMCNNSSYKVVKEGMARYLTGIERESAYVGMNFHELPLDFVKQAGAFGIEGVRVEKPEALGPALRDAIGCGRPRMVDVVIDDTVAVERLQQEHAGWLTRQR